ncbi:aspartyl/asparaginyl beta-hydroxylase isoform X4 [Amyelois transitella]|uniref:aspartyl/asparaginyl beta-hydroxylase isoform X4 n=1 Tax=Amyelois transitella TaxID=680683 RepID=UPI00298F86D3|nr:aspartyl/asparaginyl beta-hydroxylase isoform X4 [Amyelois transitella]
MSGDVQPRKRKDKKRKKDELGVEEPRGTAATLGEGDVFIHSHHDHGTGGHWCAKIIFFSLLAVLVALIGLIILENRGLTELEANSVESRYSGVLEGWLEDAPEDDHHDEHTLELNHPDDDEDDHGDEQGHDDDDETNNDDDDEDDEHNQSDNEDDDEEEDDEHNYSDDEEKQTNNEDDDENYKHDQNNDDDEEIDEQLDIDSNEENEEKNQERRYGKYYDDEDDEETANDDDDLDEVDDSEDDDNENIQTDSSIEEDQNISNNDLYDKSEEQTNDEDADNEEDEEHDEEEEEDTEVEIERIEKEIDLEPISTELPALPEEEDDDDDKSEEVSTEVEAQEKEDEDDGVAPEDLDEDFLEDDSDEPPIEHITAPVGKPLVEVEEDSSEKPPDTLAEEEEYEKLQQEKKREEEQSSHKDGGNSVHDEWPGEPSDAFWRRELDSAERELRQGSWSSAASRASAPELRGSGRARWVAARAADLEAEARRDNKLLGRAIAAYLELLKMNEKLSDKKLKEIAARTIDRIMFRGNYLSAEPVYRVLLRRFPEEVSYRNNLTISLLMANRADLAEEILKETLKKWPNDRVALAHYGFVLKTLRNRLEEAVELFQKALEGDIGPANEPRFYYHLGDALLLLGRPAEAHEVHKRGAKLGHFLSPAQRSLYNVPRLKSRPWWNIDESPYAKLARALEKSWKEILKEGEAAKSLYEKEKEGLKERGDWSQLDLFARGQEIPNRCKNAPVTCSVVRSEPAAVGCRRGQIKFSAMKPGTHVRPHVGPTNCRLRMHLALSNTKDTFIRVDQTVRQWQTGKVFMFDDSFEHEVWHNGTGTRLVLIVDVWHPDLTPQERRSLPAI